MTTVTTPDDRGFQALGALPPLRSRTSGASAATSAHPDPALEPRRLSVLLIDPSPLTRECFSLALADGGDDLSVVAASSSDQARAAGPVDVVLIHAAGESIDGDTISRELPALGSALPNVPVAVLTSRHSPTDVLNALRMGVRGYLCHDVGPRDLCVALRRISAGEVFVPAAALDAPASPDSARSEPAAEEASHPALTPRQSAVLVRIRQGKSNKVIAYELGMQESTVKVHVRNILKQLGATNRTEAVYLADLR